MWLASLKWRIVVDFAGHVTNGFSNWWVVSSPTIFHNIPTHPASSVTCSLFITVPQSMVAERFAFFPPPTFTVAQLFFGSVSLPRRSRVMMGAASTWVLRLATELPYSGLPERTEAQEWLQPAPCCDLFRLSCDERKDELSLALSVPTRHRSSFYTVSSVYGSIGRTIESLLLLTVYILRCCRLRISKISNFANFSTFLLFFSQ